MIFYRTQVVEERGRDGVGNMFRFSGGRIQN